MYFNIYGCGFAGIVSALGFCNNNVNVNAIDIDENKITCLQNNDLTQIPIELLQDTQKHLNKKLFFYNSGQEPNKPKAHIITVPTPLVGTQLSLKYINKCIEHILEHFDNTRPLQMIIRSTLPINGIKMISDFIKYKSPSIKFNLFYIPEFMREGTGLDDWNNPPLSIIGLDKPEVIPDFIADLFKHTTLNAMTFNEAISVKLFSNAFHAMKVSFANEALRVCQQNSISAVNVMNEFCKDTKLNISSKYLSPGFAWGGSCLGKDTATLSHMRTDLPLLEATIKSNNQHIQFLKQHILKRQQPNISVIGLGFKENANDYRESPIIKLVKEILSDKNIKNINILENNIDPIALFKNHRKINKLDNINQVGKDDFVIIQRKDSQKFKFNSKNEILEI